MPHGDDLREGLFRLRLVKNGPWVAAMVGYGPAIDPDTGGPLDRSWRWMVWVNGRLQSGCSLMSDRDANPAGNLIWNACRQPRITREEYEALVDDAEWARANAPGLPQANPDKPIKLGDMPSLF